MNRKFLALLISLLIAVPGLVALANPASAAPPTEIAGGQAIQHPSGGRCIDVPDATATVGTQVQLYTCKATDAANQRFLFIGRTLHIYASPGRCLQVRGTVASDAAVEIGDCTAVARHWTINDDGTIRTDDDDLNPGLCLAADGGGTASGTLLEVRPCDGSAAQKWVGPGVQNFGQQIQHPAGGRCVDAVGGSTLIGTGLQLFDCTGGARGQQWVFNDADELRIFRNECLDVQGGVIASGTAVQISDCKGTASQKWALNSNGTITVGAFCLDAAGGGTSNGTLLKILTCTGSNAQRWIGPAVSNGGHDLVHSGGLCLEVPYSSTLMGTSVQFRDCNTDGAANQQWYFTAESELRVYKNHCLDVQGGVIASGTGVQIWDCNGSNAQKWDLPKAGTVEIGGLCLGPASGSATANGLLKLQTCDGTANQQWTGVRARATSVPVVPADLRVGETISAEPGVWIPADATFTYQWLADQAAIDGARGTGATFTATSDDIGKKISVRVNASKTSYKTGASTSDETTPVTPAFIGNSQVPTIQGTTRVGETLTATDGSWGQPDPTFTYQWWRDDEAISGATAKTYALTAASKDHAVSVRVTASKSGYADSTATSASTANITAGIISNTKAPTVRGTTKVGKTLTATNGTWNQPGLAYAYRWLRDGKAIAGATAKTYKLTKASKGRKISVRVTVTKPGYANASKTSARTASIAAGTISNTKAPTVQGTTKVGKTLTATNGTWNQAGLTYTYQWLRDGKVVKGATAKTFKLTKASKGHQISVRVTVTKPGYAKASKTSARTAKIRA